MASGHIQTNKQQRRQFQRGLQMLLDTFHDTILLYTQDIQVVNFSDISGGFVNVMSVQGNLCKGIYSLPIKAGLPKQNYYILYLT